MLFQIKGEILPQKCLDSLRRPPNETLARHYATVLLPKYATTVGLGTTRSWRSQSGLRSGLGEEMRTRSRACNRAGGLERDDDSMPEDVRGQRGWR